MLLYYYMYECTICLDDLLLKNYSSFYRIRYEQKILILIQHESRYESFKRRTVMNCGALLCHQRSGYIDRLHEVKKNMQILSK